ncbi:hypothetical protein RvY_06323 [Ramazzottius varieornatus]|uniref:Annexin n=1 Tax=Ramazzottius varieornatus TaxID=947166 RepID=A0A1D1V163_RAMVA|nr:hypothetical protein RvY_06323 [Ramazzottius varieornatus]
MPPFPFLNAPDIPTLRPIQPFDPESDCKTLKKAMMGIGTDEKAIIDVLARRSIGQRLHIANIYKTMFGKDLITQLKSELSGNFEDAVVALLTPPEIYDAMTSRTAMAGAGTDEATLIEVICSRSNAELMALKAAYKFLYKKDLEKDIEGDTSGFFRKLLLACLTGQRQEMAPVDVGRALIDAKALNEAGPKKWGTDEYTFISIFALRSHPQLRETFQQFQKLTGKDMEGVVRSEMSGDLQEAFVALVQVVTNKHMYFAQRLQSSMAGAGTKDIQLIRLIVTRCERDLESLKHSYKTMFNRTLEQAIASECSGDYKQLLLALASQH